MSDGSWTAQLAGEKSSLNYNASNPSPLAGKYTVTFLGDSDGNLSPGYGSYARLIVTPDGTISVTGLLSDGTAIRQSAPVSNAGQWPLFCPLYAGKGSLFGWITFTNAPSYRLTGNVTWMKTGAYGRHYYTGFTNQMTAYGSILN